MTNEELATRLLVAYNDSLKDQCRMRYITERGGVLKGLDIYNMKEQQIIATVHAVKL